MTIKTNNPKKVQKLYSQLGYTKLINKKLF